MKPVPPRRNTGRGLTLIEALLCVAIVGVLTTAALGIHRMMWMRGGVAVSCEHLHELVAANYAYAADHEGQYCPAISADNRTRWHGHRDSADAPFETEKGYLGPYLANSRGVLFCPLLRGYRTRSFESGAGGYGYNAEYIGGTPGNHAAGNSQVRVAEGRTVMFATTALAVDDTLQEYPFTEPYFWSNGRGRELGSFQPSTHFRADGKAIVGWSDGSVTLELPTTFTGPNYYGGNNGRFKIGWFGPRGRNGFWNPSSPAARAEPGALATDKRLHDPDRAPLDRGNQSEPSETSGQGDGQGQGSEADEHAPAQDKGYGDEENPDDDGPRTRTRRPPDGESKPAPVPHTPPPAAPK